MSKEEKIEEKFEKLASEIGFKELAEIAKRIDWDGEEFMLACPRGKHWDPISKTCVVDPID